MTKKQRLINRIESLKEYAICENINLNDLIIVLYDKLEKIGE